jgi:hypothetical protein
MPEVRISARLCSSWSHSEASRGCNGADFSDKRRMRPARTRVRNGVRRMPSFSDLPEAEGFFIERSLMQRPIGLRAGLSNTNPLRGNARSI